MEISDLISSIDIVEYISQYVDLEERGDEYWGLSPFKDEKTPSFSVRKDPPVFYDYSSGIGGNVYTFVRYYHKLCSSDAVEVLKKYCGADGEFVETKKLSAINTCKKFKKPRKTLKPSKTTVLSDDHMNRYEKSPEKLSIWEKEGISNETMDFFQVRYDSFSDRIVYPIRNIDGKIVNVGGRTVDPDWKEKGLRKYNYFYQWGTLDVIYGAFENMEEIMKKREIILFEGCKSVLIAHTWGIKNCGAILTSHLNPNQMKLLVKLGCRVVFALDKDVNILKDHNIAKLKDYVNVEFVRDTSGLLNEKDSPVDQGKDVFYGLYEQRKFYR